MMFLRDSAQKDQFRETRMYEVIGSSSESSGFCYGICSLGLIWAISATAITVDLK